MIQEWLTRFMTFQGVDDAVAEEMAILPGMEELFSLLKVQAATRTQAVRRDRHRLRAHRRDGPHAGRARDPELLLQAHLPHPAHRPAGRCGRWPSAITDMPLPSDDVFGAVQDALRASWRAWARCSRTRERSSIRIVLNPERMVINESQRLYTYLNLFGFPVDAVIANRVLPPEARSGVLRPLVRHPGRPPGGGAPGRSSRCPSSRRACSTARWSGVPLLDEFGARGLRRRATRPRVFFEERPIEVKKEGKGYAMYIRLPFAEKDRIQVWTQGEELVVSVDNQRRHILLPAHPGLAPAAGRRLRGPAAARGVRREGGRMAG